MNLLLAAVLLLQDKSAEETFKKIEETVAAAKTLSLKFDVKLVKAVGVEESVLKGTILLKKGDRMSLDSAMIKGGDQREMMFVSDGSQISARADGRIRGTKETPKDFNAHLTTLLTRAGAIHFIGGVTPVFFGDGLNLEKAPSVTEIRTGEDDGTLKTLTYKTVVTPLVAPPATVDVRLWYEPKSLRLVRRTLSYKSETVSRIFNETYEEFTLDADIPDEKFKLPEEKK
jgi:outer membrane lipoprotein-sorting protein